MTKHDVLTAEYSQIVGTAFWAAFMDRIREYRGTLSRQCETEDTPAKSQGGIIALDYLLGRKEQPPLAERLLSELKKKS